MAKEISAPTVPPSSFMEYEAECRRVMAPHLEVLIKNAEAAGWEARVVATALMYLSAKLLPSG